MSVSKKFAALLQRLPMLGQRLAWVDFNWGGYEEDGDKRVVLDSPLEEANVITSLVDVHAMTGIPLVPGKVYNEEIAVHRPVIDIDHVVKVVQSSTAGHSHLFIDLAIPWDHYVRLLEVMAEIGLVEPGYVNASKARGYTAVRLPWVSKNELTDQEVMGA